MSKQKLNLWKQLETILNSNIMTLKEKNQAITNLTTFALYKKTGNTFELNQLFQEAIWETITLTDPTIQSILIRKLQGYDQFNVLIKKHKEAAISLWGLCSTKEFGEEIKKKYVCIVWRPKSKEYLSTNRKKFINDLFWVMVDKSTRVNSL